MSRTVTVSKQIYEAITLNIPTSFESYKMSERDFCMLQKFYLNLDNFQGY